MCLSKMSTAWNVKVKIINGQILKVEAVHGADTTIFNLKGEIEKYHDVHPPAHRQRLVFHQPGSIDIKLEDDNSKLSSYNGLADGSTVVLIVLSRFILYVTGLDGKTHEMEIPSSTPKDYLVAELFTLLEKVLKHNMSKYQVLFRDEPLEVVRHGKQMKLKDIGLKSSDTLHVTELGITITVVNPQIDLCFLVDCTGSMQSHIDAVNDCIKEVQQDLVQQFQGCDVHFAFVRYTDYDQPQSSRTTYIDFTKNQGHFYTFVDEIIAEGGRDGPEDVMGGLQTAFSQLSWGDEDVIKVLVHVADAPCHGSQYHSLNDNYPNGDPAGITHDQMMAKVADCNIQYWFGFIESDLTDKMIQIFNKSLQKASDRRLLIKQISAKEPKEMEDAVKRTVMNSVYGAEITRRAAMKPYQKDLNYPDWGPIALTKGKKTTPPPLKSMDDLQKGLTLEPPATDISFKCAPNPFAEGEECIVYYGYDVTGKRKVVLKKYKRKGDEFNKLDCYMKELKIRIITNTYTKVFTEKLRPHNSIQIAVNPLEIVQCEESRQVYMLESFLVGSIEKFNNNAGMVWCKAKESDVMQALSHFSWVSSGRSLLICDLQGVNLHSTMTITDPAIHSMTPGCYGFTDHGPSGIKRFFKTHKCGNACTQMGLADHQP